MEQPSEDLAHIREQVLDLHRRLSDQQTKKRWWRLSSEHSATHVALVAVFFSVLFAFLYLHSAGLLILSPSSSAHNDHIAGPERSAASSASMPQTGSNKGEFRDLLTILVPMFAAGVAFVVSAAGMRRLQTYDEELARARQERREDAKDLRNEFITLRQELREDLDKKTGELLKEKLQEIEEQVEELQGKAEHEIKEAADRTRAAVNDVAAKLDRDFGFLKGEAHIAYFGEQEPISVGELHKEVSRLFGERTVEARKEAVNKLAAALALPDRMHGTPDDWFNLSAELGRQDQELLAFEVCEKSLARFADPTDPNDRPNSDLLAHAIQFAAKLGRWQACKRYLDAAEKLGRASWNWRLFTFVGDYYGSRQDENNFLQVNRDFSHFLPDSEQAYSQVATYWRNRGKNDLALEAVERGIESLGSTAERLYLTKAQLLLDKGEYDGVINATTQALRAQAVDQPGSSQMIAVFLRSNAYDAEFFGGIGEVSSVTGIPETTKAVGASLARLALSGYRWVLNDNGAPLTHRMQAKTRIHLIEELCRQLSIDLGSNTAGAGAATKSEGRSIDSDGIELLCTQFVELADRMLDWTESEQELVASQTASEMKHKMDADSCRRLSAELRKEARIRPAIAQFLESISRALA